MKELENLKELYLEQIKKIYKKGDITPQDDEAVNKALDRLIKIEELCGQEDEMQYSQDGYLQGYSQRGRIPSMRVSSAYMPEMSTTMPYYNDGYSERRGRNQRNGQYMSRNDYSRHGDAVDGMIDKLEAMRMEAPDQETRRAIDRCIEKLENY